MCLRSTWIPSDPALVSLRQIPVHLANLDYDCDHIIKSLFSVRPLPEYMHGFMKQRLFGSKFDLKKTQKKSSLRHDQLEPE